MLAQVDVNHMIKFFKISNASLTLKGMCIVYEMNQ